MAMLHFRLQLLWSPFGVHHSHIDLRSAGALPKFDDGFFLNTTSVLSICDFIFFFQGGLGVITKNWPVHFPGSIFQDYFLDRFSITESGASAFFVTFTIQMLPWQALKKWDWKWWKIVLEVLCIRNSTSLSNLNAPCMYVKDPSAKEEEKRLYVPMTPTGHVTFSACQKCNIFALGILIYLEGYTDLKM